MESNNPQLEQIYQKARTYLPTIEKVYQGTNQDIVESQLLGELLKLLADLPQDFHMFCDPVLEPIAIFCLTIFSFSEQETATWLKNKFNYTLSKCEKCILSFARGKCKMLQHFAIQRHVPHEHVAKFNDIVCLWRVEATIPRLKKISSLNGTTVEITDDIRTVIYEALCNPHMLRLNQDFKNLFNVVFKYLYETKYSLLDVNSNETIKTFVAGVIYCWCEGTQEQINWSKAFMTKLHKDKFRMSIETVTPDIIEEISFHVLFLQNPSHWNDFVISQFWARLIPIFGLLDADVFEEYFIVPKDIESLQKSFRFQFESIFILWYKHLAKVSQDKPLDFMLRALYLFLDKMDDKFWLKIEPFTFHSVLDIIFEKNAFVTTLAKVQNNRVPEDDTETYFSLEGSITDLLSWTLPFFHSLSPPRRIQMVKKASIAFLRVVATYQDLKPIPKACLMNSSTALLRAVLTIKDDERAGLYAREDFQTVLFTKSDSRTLLNNPLVQDIVIKSATHASDIYPGLGQSIYSVSRSAMMVLAKCIDFDILLLCQRTFKLYRGESVSEIPLPLTLLENLNKNISLQSFDEGPLLGKYLLISLRNINGLLPIPGNTTSIAKHNEIVDHFLKLATDLIGKFTDILPNKLSEVLTDKEAAQGFWSCIFSSNTQLYQVATNILYDTFDVEGRLEGIHAILNKNLPFQLKAIIAVLQNLVRCEYYEPCPRAVRVLMDILSAFSNPISGILSNYSSIKSDETDKEITVFWNISWEFLDTIYRCTLTWASKYEYSELENFTKDTLELSRSFVNSFREFSDAISNPNADLFSNVLKAFKNMLYWLRLSDDELLESCVRLIISTTDLAQERQMKFDDDLIETMARYACKAKKFSNKLTDKQTREILTKASIFNKKLVDDVAESVEKLRKEKELSKMQPISASNATRLTGSSENRADFLKRKALASSILGRPKASQPKITSFGVFKHGTDMKLHSNKVAKPLSKMELARRQLLSNRVIHPPSSSVFNTKSNAIIKNDDSSSDESEDENNIETARELFATAKAKGHGIETLDINGKMIKKNSKADLAKIEEENLRRRLNVDINPLYETILKWDYTRRNEYPTDGDIGDYKDIKDQFSSVAEYKTTVKPLLLLECWQGLCAARDRIDNNPFSVIVGNRTAISDFYEVYTSLPKSILESCKIMESDLIALAYFPDLRPGQRLNSNSFRNAQHTCLAKIRSITRTKNNNVDLTLRIHRDHNFSKFLSLRSEIHAIKVMQMTTVEREYQSLEALEFYDLASQILSAKPSPEIEVSPEEVTRVKRIYKLNTSQAEAIVNTVLKEGFSLIQGPPGTGKTKTILGIVGYFLSMSKMLPTNVIKAPTDSLNIPLEQLLKKQKVLICAPSNAAVDEICIRLKEGVYDSNGVIFKPNLVRVGRSDVVNVAIKDLTLEELVERRLTQKNYEFNQNPELEEKFNSAVVKRRKLRDKLNSENGSPESSLSVADITKLQSEIRDLSKELNALGRERDELRERNSLNYRKRDIDRRNAQMQIMAGSDIICSTLSGSAHDVLAMLGVKFDTVIIDEACQCTELGSIIPLRYGGRRCIMVGDPNQLPPTVLSGAASNFKYNQSLFVRMEKNSTPYLLNVQYRMHPDISKFPSREFYNDKLKDGPDMAVIDKRPWHECSPLTPYRFFDIISGRQEQNTKTMSYVNKEEIQVAIELVTFLFNKYDKVVDFTGKIGVISPYREQMQRMRKEFTMVFGSVIQRFIDFNTIDGFQGQEKDIIIISCVRADDTKSSVGFLKDFRRMNVAFTRAKASLWILGHQKSLYKNKLWKNLIDDATQRKSIQQAYSGFLSKNIQNPQIQSRLGSNPRSIVEEHDSYDPFSRSNNTGTKRHLDDRYNAKEPYLKKQKEVKSKTDTPDKKDKKDKKVKKDKKDKKEKKDKKDKINKSSEDSSISTGTRKKSSIFGGTSAAVPSPKVASNVYINDEKTNKERKEKHAKRKHITFSDDITTILENDLPKVLAPSKSLNPPAKKIRILSLGEVEPVTKDDSENKTKTKKFPKEESKTDNTDEDDYSPSFNSENLNVPFTSYIQKHDAEDKHLQKPAAKLSPIGIHDSVIPKISASKKTSVVASVVTENKSPQDDKIADVVSSSDPINVMSSTTLESINQTVSAQNTELPEDEYEPHAVSSRYQSRNQRDDQYYPQENKTSYQPINYDTEETNSSTQEFNPNSVPMIGSVAPTTNKVTEIESKPIQMPVVTNRADALPSRPGRRGKSSTPFIPKKRRSNKP